MANISVYLQKILSAIYGEEVRGSIHDALAAMNVESSNAIQFASTAKDSAQASASSAQSSATAAAQKANAASASAQAAKVSETNVINGERNAAAKAAEAAASASAAKASEASAIQMASEAAASKNAAALSESNALASEQRIKNVKDTMETLGAQAAADKASAEAARDAANASQAAAASSAASAATSAGDAAAARDAVEDAQTAVEIAKNAAETARDTAEAARDGAETFKNAARTSEINAAASALSAQNYSGKAPMPQDGTWWTWDAGKQKYVDTGISCELAGPAGNGIEEINLTSGDHTPGTVDRYTIVMTNGNTASISVYNGRNGSGAGDVLGISFDLVLPASGWANGELTVADSRLLALATHKYFIDAYENSYEEYRDCNVRPKDIVTNGFITFCCESTPAEDLTVNVLRLELSVNGTP